MPVDPIGNQAPGLAAASSLNQQEFLRLFLSSLRNQDPLQAMDNSEFLAQLAQFANLEQVRQTNASLESLVIMNSAAQSIGLLGLRVEVDSDTGFGAGEVTAVRFTETGPTLTVDYGTPRGVDPNVRLSQVKLVLQEAENDPFPTPPTFPNIPRGSEITR
jgi:flagellar basal-body rod modification protein FlgD